MLLEGRTPPKVKWLCLAVIVEFSSGDIPLLHVELALLFFVNV